MTLREKIALFPHNPGVYRYYDSDGNIIYIGKAKDLHKRVAQYFVSPERLTRKTAIMVSKIADAQYSVVDSEADALLLENNLIKQYKPKYNILLKDSKTYPWICITGEPFPRLFLTRRRIKGEGEYFGPYSSVLHARALLELFSRVYKLRSCRYNITSDAVLRGKFRPCLDYHIKKCGAPCIGGVSVEQYNADIDEIRALLKGGTAAIIANYRALMQQAADKLDFETAQQCKLRMDQIHEHYSRSVISGGAELNCDVFTLILDGTEAFGNFLRVRGGNVIQSLNLGFRLGIEESKESVMSSFIEEIRQKLGALSAEILVPFLPDAEFTGSKMVIPSRGAKLSLLELSAKNAREMQFNSLKQQEHSNPDEFYRKTLEELQHAIGMSVLPEHIECFDNSNIQGTNPVASCVVFRGGKPSKKDYRHFNIKTVVGANDYASMKEVVNRRYSRMLAEAPDDIPQLVVIDGGKGQLAFAHEALAELGLVGGGCQRPACDKPSGNEGPVGAQPAADQPAAGRLDAVEGSAVAIRPAVEGNAADRSSLVVVGLAKRMEEVIRVGDPYPLFLDRNSQALKLLQRLRDEAHRFGITHHRSRRSKAQIDSALRHIKGVGEKMEERLLLHFGSVSRIAAATTEDIAAITGPALAQRIKAELKF